MTQAAIQVEGISKQYQLGLREKARKNFREALIDMVHAPLKRLKHLSGRSAEGTFWALRDISFDVPEGEVLGIIGHNGAGKSTLLKILSRITEPTEGRALIHGRIASLLEVGTGFHQELTGRENVYLNGAILGMSKSEIIRKFDEIVDFSGVERFLDTPIKHYSSGMKVRLAFAVAAHLEPEILIIDEVLAVGDQEFQNKCLGKMQDVATSGRTVLFVSHNLPAVESLCSTALCLNAGAIVERGTATEVVHAYLSHGAKHQEYGVALINGKVIHSIRLLSVSGELTETVPVGGNLRVEVTLAGQEPLEDPAVRLVLDNRMGVRIFTSNSRFQYGRLPQLPAECTVNCCFDDLRLSPGDYCLSASVMSGKRFVERVEPALQIRVVPTDLYGTGRIPRGEKGVYLPRAQWSFSSLNPQSALEEASCGQ